MALYNDLTPEQQAILSAWERNARGFFNQLASLIVAGRAIQAAANASNGPRDIVTSLDAGQEIPNSSGLAGAHDMTKAEWAALISVLDNFLTTHDTDAVRQLNAKAAGPTAGL